MDWFNICFVNAKVVTMPSNSNQPTRNWLELPSDLMFNIPQRVGAIDRLENAQSQCQLVYLTTVCVNAINLLPYVADRSRQLRRLEIVPHYNDLNETWSEVFKKMPLLEELNLVSSNIRKEDIEAAGRYCPLLRTLKVNKSPVISSTWSSTYNYIHNELAVSIGKNLPELTHLELVGSSMTNIGLRAILDGCHRLELLDLRRCLYIDLKGELGKRCSQQIKHLKLAGDPLDGLPYISYGLYETRNFDINGLYVTYDFDI
ncbi:putative F-box/LRR-repeat protein 23 [Bidens hawaiensis]|uniref:putative F-box/LRR-repeat protein 23 n=1 Tax=Bidens hawaiensis TaxID=980011 RepID=UPI00404AA0C3